jgi:hypothetical protein
MHYYTFPPEVANEKLYYPGIEYFIPGGEPGNTQE